MSIGASVFLIAAGAILRFAVADNVDGIALGTVGLILMVAGAIGLVASLILYSSRRPVAGRGVVREREYEY